MTTLRRWRKERSYQRSHSPERSLDIDNYDWKINRYQKANWGDIEAKEAHASVVKYLWRKEYELNKKKEDLKKQIAKQKDIISKDNNENQSKSQEVLSHKSNESIMCRFTKREIEAPMRGIHFRTIEDKTFEKLNLIRSERNLENNISYIEKIRTKANTDIDDDIDEDLKIIIRGRSAYQISKALLAESGRSAKEDRLRELENFRLKQRQHRGIYDIMADRNKLGISYDDNSKHQSVSERKTHADHDYRWNNYGDYLNLVGYRMQSDTSCGFRSQNHGEIIWGALK